MSCPHRSEHAKSTARYGYILLTRHVRPIALAQSRHGSSTPRRKMLNSCPDQAVRFVAIETRWSRVVAAAAAGSPWEIAS